MKTRHGLLIRISLQDAIAYSAFPTAIIALFSYYFFGIGRTTRNPPLVEESITSILLGKQKRGANLLNFYLEVASRIGLVFRMRFPWRTVVCHPKLARLILSGNVDNKECDRYPAIYKSLKEIFFGYPTIFTKRTIGEGWDWARRGVAPAFSNFNLQKCVPKFNSTLTRLSRVLNTLSDDGFSFSISSVMLHVTFDFLTSALFDIDFHTLDNDPKSAGIRFLEANKIVLREYGFLRIINPWRWMYFWDKDVIRAYKERQYAYSFVKNIMEDYMLKHTEEERLADSSMLGRLSRS